MTLNVRMGLDKLPKDNNEVYSILLSDTVLVEDATEVLTSRCTKKFDDVCCCCILSYFYRFLMSLTMNLNQQKKCTPPLKHFGNPSLGLPCQSLRLLKRMDFLYASRRYYTD